MIKIFSHYLTGIDAQNFCKKSKQEKFEWIKKRTNFPEDVINDFLNKPLRKVNCGCGCGEKQQENEPIRVQSQTEQDNENSAVAADNGETIIQESATTKRIKKG